MERPTKITVIKKNDGYEIICMDEMSGSSIGIDMPINGYLALAEHFRTGAMEISSDELSGLHKHVVNGSILDDMGYEVADMNETLSNDEWNEKLKAHGKWLIQVAHEAADNLCKYYR